MIGTLIYLYFVLIGITCRFKLVCESQAAIELFRNRKAAIWTFWFEHVFFFLYYFRRTRTCFFISTQNRFDPFTTFAKFIGVPISKALLESGGRHAMLNLIEELKVGHPVLVSADGSRNPQYKFKTQSLLLAQETNTPILPMAIRQSFHFRVRILGCKVALPLPFSKIEIRIGTPFYIRKNLQIEELEGLKTQLANELQVLSN